MGAQMGSRFERDDIVTPKPFDRPDAALVAEMIDFLETDRVWAVFSPRGLAWLSLRPGGDGPADERPFLVREISLRQALDTSPAQPDDATRLIVTETLRFLATGRHQMPLDLSVFTPFQQRVFAAVSQIEPGTIRTYKEVAVLIGQPGAARAVGNAVGRNPVAYFLPVHRVLPQKGLCVCRSGAGFIKRKLLAREGHDVDRLTGAETCQRRCRLE